MPALTREPALPHEQLCVLSGRGPGDPELFEVVQRDGIEVISEVPLTLAVPVPCPPSTMRKILAFEASRIHEVAA